MPDGPPGHFYLRGRPGLDTDLTWGNVSQYNRRAEVTTVERLTTCTVLLSFKVTDGSPFAFLPGQWIGVEEEVPDVGFRRSSYCIFSPPGDEEHFQLLIRVLVDGPLSQHLARLEPGHPIRFRGPMGRNMLPKPSDTELVLLATGVGIAPLYSLCGHLATVGEGRRIRLFWGLRSIDDICLTDQLQGFRGGLPAFGFEISLSDPPPGWTGARGRVTESVPPLLERLVGPRFYLSGNGAMIEEMELALCSLGVDRTSISEERFFNLKPRPEKETMDAIMARFVAGDVTDAQARLRSMVWRITQSPR